MRNLVSDFVSFIRSLSFMNILFFAAVILLIVLVVALIYIMKVNSEIEEEDEEVVKTNNEEDIDLKNISRAIEEDVPNPIILNYYEKEQEEKAIISYDELIASQSKNEEVINYKEEKDIEGLKVKSFDLNNLTTTIDLPKAKAEKESPQLYNYKKEEEFLDALKRLQKSL